ncbi:unnamed protein product, partial [Musa textilis]
IIGPTSTTTSTNQFVITPEMVQQMIFTVLSALDFRAKVRLFLLLGLLILEHPIICLAHLIRYIIYDSILVNKIFRLLMVVNFQLQPLVILD